jgi:hypothetical protein
MIITRYLHDLLHILHFFIVLFQKTEVPSIVYYITLHVLHSLYNNYMYYIYFTYVRYFSHLLLKMNFFGNLWAANLFNVHEDVCARPSTWFVEYMQSFPGDEPWALCLIKVNSIHELDSGDASAVCDEVELNTSAPLPRTPLPPCRVRAGVTSNYRTTM